MLSHLNLTLTDVNFKLDFKLNLKNTYTYT